VIKANLIVGTTNNYAPISMSVAKAARSLIKGGTVITEGLLNRVEMAFRAYDPCMSCATHSLPGQMPLEVTVRDARGAVVAQLSQYVAWQAEEQRGGAQEVSCTPLICLPSALATRS
jgi:F420-non-reducing hydrogenase large subunit